MNQQPNAHLPAIVLLDGSRALTGAFVCARNIARALKGRARVILIIGNDSTLDAAATQDFSEVRRLPIRHIRRSFFSVIFYIPTLIISSLLIRQILSRYGAKAFLVNDYYMMHGAACRLLGFRGRVLTWVRMHPGAFGPLSRLWLWAGAQTSDAFIPVSRHISSLMPARYKKIMLYDGIAKEICGKQDADQEQADLTFLYIGNYIEGKGQDISLIALSIVRCQIPDVRIEFYGSDMGLAKNMAYKRSLSEMAEVMGISANVHFGDFLHDPESAMANKIAALNLSRSESFSMTVLEASARGLPVIATRCGGPEEIIDDGRTGCLIPIDNASACAEAMLRLCMNPSVARQMGKAAQAKVLEQFSFEIFRDGLLSVLSLDEPTEGRA